MVSKEIFAALDAWLFTLLLRWAKRRHPRKSAAWVTRTYWRRESGGWDFGPKGGPRLVKYRRQPIRRHIKVISTKSIYDGDWPYWAHRLGRHPLVPAEVAQLLKRQQGKCAHCGLYFRDSDVKERDHVLPVVLGGAAGPRQLLHGHCHDVKTAQDGSYAARGTH